MRTRRSDGEPGQPTPIDSTPTSHAHDRAQAPRVCGNTTPIVVVGDDHAATVAGLDDALAACRLTPRWIADGSALAQLRRSDDCGIALVAVAGEPTSSSPALDAVALLKRNGYTVVCYGDRANRWPLGAQCRLLLAGAFHLFDSSDGSFVSDLRLRLDDLLHAEIERQREDRRIKEQMLGLGVVGTSPAITNVFRWIIGVSPVSDLPVLIVGETGTGKELAARAIHHLDPRRGHGPFLAVNCGAINPALAESELFGHRRGAFTGAEHDRKGLIRAARGGVLFLDEIGDLDANLQGKLLRVLQERRVLALGEDHEVPVDVRIIAATNRDLEEMVRKHEFRADLFHRLNVLSTRIPALRERPEDIEPLVQHFIAKCTDQVYQHAVSASSEFVQALCGVELPGNVRQLENLVRRALVTWRRGDQLRLADLPPELWFELGHGEEGAPAAPAPAAGAGSSGEASPTDPSAGAATDNGNGALLDAVAVLEASSWQLERALDLCEQKIVAAALGASSGNRSRAARLLGISPRSIFNKMRKYRLTA